MNPQIHKRNTNTAYNNITATVYVQVNLTSSEKKTQ